MTKESQNRKLIFSYGYFLVGIMGIFIISTPSYSNLLSGIDLTDDSAQSNARGAAPGVGLEMAVQPTGTGNAYDSDGDLSSEPGLFGSRARYSYPVKSGGLTVANSSGFGEGASPFSSDGSDGADANDGNDGNDGDEGDNPLSNLIVPEEVIQDNVVDASDLLTEVNFKNYRYVGLLNSL